MINRTNQVIEIDDNEEYLILRQIAYKSETYYVTTRIYNGGETFDKKIILLKESTVDGETYVTVVDDPEIIKTILEHLTK